MPSGYFSTISPATFVTLPASKLFVTLSKYLMSKKRANSAEQSRQAILAAALEEFAIRGISGAP